MSVQIAVIGKTGQLARALISQGEKRGYDIIALDRNSLDLTSSQKTIEDVISALPSSLDAIIIAAAYTNVDGAEEDRETAYVVNAITPGIIARSCALRNTPLIHVSTDYVFDGQNRTPYLPNSSTNPLGVYGSSKLDGELEVLESGARALIFRTTWVYDGKGKNFLTTMLKLAKDRNKLSIVNDQIGRPTYAGHLAQAILEATYQFSKDSEIETAIHHITNSGDSISWAEFAEAIFMNGDKKVKVNKIPSSEYPTPTERPLYSVLNTDSFEESFQHALPDWKIGLYEAMKEYSLQNLADV